MSNARLATDDELRDMFARDADARFADAIARRDEAALLDRLRRQDIEFQAVRLAEVAHVQNYREREAKRLDKQNELLARIAEALETIAGSKTP